MKAAVYSQYGPPEVLQIRDIPKPVPKKNEVLIEVHAATVAAGDWRIRKADPPVIRLINGIFRPRKKVLGMEIAGRVVALGGPKASRFSIGQRVFGSAGMRFGAYGEYCCLPESKGLLALPDDVSYEHGAALPIGANTALYYLREKAGIQPGQSILIYGASGSVGTYAVQLATHFGATVTAVTSTDNLKWVKDFGAHEVVDYKADHWSRSLSKFDIVFDAVGKLDKQIRRSFLDNQGKYISVDRGLARIRMENLEWLIALVKNGIITPVIEKTYPLDKIAEAHAHAEAGHKKGNIVIQVYQGHNE